MVRWVVGFVLVSTVMACCTADPRSEASLVSQAISAKPPAAPVEPPAPPPPTRVKVSDLTPYFQGEPLESAVEDFEAGRNAAAAKAFGQAAETLQDPEAARAATFMALLAHHDAGVCDPTAERLEAMASDWPLMGSYAWFYAGSCHLKADRPDAARKAFAEVPADSPLSPRAGEQLAESWLALDRPDRAIAALEASVTRHPDARGSSWFRLAKLREAAGDTAGTAAAWRELAARKPRSVEGRAARKNLGDDHGLTATQLHGIAMAFYRAQSHRKALKAFEVVLDVTQAESLPEDLNDDARAWLATLHCDARVKTARTYGKMKKRKVAWRHFARALGCKGEPLADATFAGGRNRLRAEDYERAIRVLRRHVVAFPKRSTVDDALVMIAKAQRAMGDDAAADATLLDVLRTHPQGDLIDEAAWSLLWPLVDARKWRSAVKMADTLLGLVSRERSYRAEGRTLYWRSRALQRLRKHDEAMVGYREVLAQYPLSWYALLAHERLKRHDAEGAKAALTAVMEAGEPPASPLKEIPDPLWSNPHFRRGVELVRMGLTTSARRELQAVSLDKDQVDPRVLTWIKVALYQAAGAHDLATHLARRQEPSFGAHWPVGEHRQVWELAHQRGFSSLVERWAADRGIDPAWIYSIIREESGFNPKIESWANAIGLMQIIMPTARGLAKGTTINPTAANLRKPEVAIELGTKYLRDLLKRHVALPLASAGYNAGSGAVSKWRRAWGRQEIDEFVERIPYREARGYAKRVTRSVARYRWLHGDGEILDLPLDPPGRP